MIRVLLSNRRFLWLPCFGYLALATQHNSFEEVENTLTTGPISMGEYYKQNQLKPNPSKTQIGASICAIVKLIES